MKIIIKTKFRNHTEDANDVKGKNNNNNNNSNSNSNSNNNNNKTNIKIGIKIKFSKLLKYLDQTGLGFAVSKNLQIMIMVFLL